MRLLVIEDDEKLGSSLKQHLERAGFAVDVATNGIDGEHLATEEDYDAVVLDLGLPDRSGLNVLRNLREIQCPVPVIILTARDAWHERIDGFKAGADDYVGKPFHVEELIVRIQAVLRRYRGHSGGPLQLAGLTLDEDTQTVTTRDSRQIQLTGTEFRLLRYFMLNPGKILAKDTLIEHVYDYDFDRDSNVIEVYIKRLRQKLGRDLITTRRGQGYVFEPPNT
jgi:DNA-binding response OmpR family regulator